MALRKKRRIKIFITSNPTHRLFGVLSFVSVLILSIYCFNKIDSFPLSIDSVVNKVWIIFLLILIGYANSVINKNLSMSKDVKLLSYGITLIVNAYLYSIVFFFTDFGITKWLDFLKIYYHLLALMCINAFWILMISIFEKKTRPFFAKYYFNKYLITMTVIVISLIVWFSYKNNLHLNLKGDFTQNFITYLIIVVIGLLILFWIILFIRNSILQYRYKKNDILKNSISSVISNFAQMISLLVWTLMSFHQIKINFYEIIYFSLALLFILFIYGGLCFKLINFNDRFLIELIGLAVVILSVMGFIFVNQIDITSSTAFLTFMLFMIAVQLAIIISWSYFPNIYILLNELLVKSIIIMGILIWNGNKLFGEINFFEINVITWGLVSVIAVVQLFINIIWIFNRSGKIAKRLRKINKSVKKKKIKEAMDLKLNKAKATGGGNG